MVSTAQLLDFLEAVEAEASGSTQGLSAEIDVLEAKKQEQLPSPVDDTIAPLRTRINDLDKRLHDIERFSRDKHIYLKKQELKTRFRSEGDNPKTKFDAAVEQCDQQLGFVEQAFHQQEIIHTKNEQDGIKSSARKPLYAIGGMSVVGVLLWVLTLGGGGIGILILGLIPLIPAAIGFGSIELRANSSGCLATIARLIYILIGGLYFLSFGILMLASVASFADDCSDRFMCLKGLYGIMTLVSSVLFLMACWILWKGFRNKLPLPTDKL